MEWALFTIREEEITINCQLDESEQSHVKLGCSETLAIVMKNCSKSAVHQRAKKSFIVFVSYEDSGSFTFDRNSISYYWLLFSLFLNKYNVVLVKYSLELDK